MAEEERDRKWTVLRLRGLRKRWIVNTILPVLVLLMLLVTLVSVGVSTYYYSSMENGLMKQAEAMSSAFNDYFMNSYSEYNQMATQAVDTYEDKSRIEPQFIGSTGRIQMSTSGLTAGKFRRVPAILPEPSPIRRSRPSKAETRRRVRRSWRSQRPCCSTAGWRASCGW